MREVLKQNPLSNKKLNEDLQYIRFEQIKLIYLFSQFQDRMNEKLMHKIKLFQMSKRSKEKNQRVKYQLVYYLGCYM